MSDDAVRTAYLGEIAVADEIADAEATVGHRTDDQPSDADAPRPSTAAAPLLELRDVDAGYGPFRALFGVSFSVPEGKVVALLGAQRRRQDHDRPRRLGPDPGHGRARCCSTAVTSPA